MEELVSISNYYPLGKLNFSDDANIIRDFTILKEDKKILKELAAEKAEIAQLSIHQKKINMWKALNSLAKVRPIIWINEIPWHEMNVDDELTLRTTTNFSKFLETRLRRTIYLWKHMPADMVVEPTLPCYIIINNTGLGISEKVDIVKTDIKNDVISRKFTPQIQSEEDIEKIKIPKISYNKKATEEKYQIMKNIFGGILRVEKRAIPGFWFAPWDELIRWLGVQEGLTDLVLRPKLVHKIMERLISAYLSMLDQYESKNLLALNNGNYRIGSGGLGYTDELPHSDFDPDHIKTRNLWGNSAAQIFSCVSPEMHEEFALQYEIRWMKRFGLNYYGCCEPLDKKIEILKKIPNLRKISMSPWVNLELCAAKIGKDYVFSWKPSPVIFAKNNWDPISVRKKFREDLKKLKVVM